MHSLKNLFDIAQLAEEFWPFAGDQQDKAEEYDMNAGGIDDVVDSVDASVHLTSCTGRTVQLLVSANDQTSDVDYEMENHKEGAHEEPYSFPCRGGR